MLNSFLKVLAEVCVDTGLDTLSITVKHALHNCKGYPSFPCPGYYENVNESKCVLKWAY